MGNDNNDRLLTDDEKSSRRRQAGNGRQASVRQRFTRQGSVKQKPSRKERIRQQQKRCFTVKVLFCLVIFLLGMGVGWKLHDKTIRKLIDPSSVEMPSWIDKQLLTVNKYSRPGKSISIVNGIVIHYVANPGTTAQQNRDYFEGLKNQSGSKNVFASSNFVIGLDGEIIECVPVGEVAYASNDRNNDTISIECCHPESDGKFTDETYDSLVILTAWLCKELDLSPKEVIRHYDVTGKICPKYFVDHEDAWKQFHKDVRKKMKQL